MIKSMGRLNIDDYKIMDAHVDKIFKNLDKGKNSLATKQILEMANTANYFVREELGKRLATYPGKGDPDTIMAAMLEDVLYGVRATALFYFYYKRQDAPEVIIKTLEKTYKTVPWESETICFEMWKRAPEIMREQMSWWAESPDENKRAMAMHGRENIASRNPQYLLTIVSRLLDDESEEVQKKISHILTQVARQRPLQCYTNIRRWLTEADEKRVRTIWQTMKKLASIYGQRSQRDKSQDFINYTQRTIAEWKQDSHPKVQQMGHRLSQIINKK